jgi:hypothetical protein
MARLSRRFQLSSQQRWPGPRSLVTTSGVSVDVLSSRYLDISVPWVRFFTPMDSGKDTSLEARNHRPPSLTASEFLAPEVGCPIRKSADQSLFAAPHGLSQRTTSFIASCCQGIHQMPLSRLIVLIINAHAPRARAPQAYDTDHNQPALGRADWSERPDFRDKPNSSAVIRCRLGERSLRTSGISPLHDVKDQTVEGAPAMAGPSNLVLSRHPRRQSQTGGARRDRTDDLLLAKQALSQLSYGPVIPHGTPSPKRWWAWVDSNYRPHAYQACALTT